MIFRKLYGIDLGSSSVKIYSMKKNTTYEEKNMIAYRGNRILCVGDEAYEMFEKNPQDIHVESPMSAGMIANRELVEIMLYSMMRKIEHQGFLSASIYFSVPTDLSAMEKQVYYSTANGAFLRKNKVYMVEAPICDAIAMGISLNPCPGSMIVNMGAQKTQVSIIADGRVIISKSIPIGGRQMDEAICSEIRSRYSLNIGTRTARRLKVVMGRLNTDRKEARKVIGIDSVSGLPREETISSYVISDGIRNCMDKIVAEMKVFLERIPPQIRGHIAAEGIYLTGGCTRLPFLNHYLATGTGFSYKLSDLYESATIRGLEILIHDKELRSYAVPVKQRIL